MIIKIKCPVCNARNELTTSNLSCRRCQEDLSLMYRVKAYSFKYRLYLAQILLRYDAPQRIQFAQSAAWLLKPELDTPNSK